MIARGGCMDKGTFSNDTYSYGFIDSASRQAPKDYEQALSHTTGGGSVLPGSALCPRPAAAAHRYVHAGGIPHRGAVAHPDTRANSRSAG